MIYRNITDIKPNPKNPRVIKDEKFAKLVQSLKDFPEMLEKRPLVCFTDTDCKLVVLGGNMRLKAAKEIGLKKLPVMLADDWTEEQKQQRKAARERNRPAREQAALERIKKSTLLHDLDINRIRSGFYSTGTWGRVCRLQGEVLETLALVKLLCEMPETSELVKN